MKFNDVLGTPAEVGEVKDEEWIWNFQEVHLFCKYSLKVWQE